MSESKSSQFFSCKLCHFKSSRKSQYERHILTEKHKILTNTSNKVPQEIICDCGKNYKHRQSLYNHKKLCTFINENNCQNINDGELSDKQIIMMLIKDNSEFKKMMFEQNKCMMEVVKNGTYNTINSNNNNKTFNLQLFLNETCKDAINLSEFINQIQVSISDLEETGKLGYAEGISKVFIKNLNDIDYNMRPIHCSDSKRETIYIKENDEWSKDDDKKCNLTKAIKQVANKNIKNICEWQKLHPDYSNPDSKENDKYMKIVLNSMSGTSKEEADKNYEKIAKNICKEVLIEKSS